MADPTGDALMASARMMWSLAAATLNHDTRLRGMNDDEVRVMIGAVLNAVLRHEESSYELDSAQTEILRLRAALKILAGSQYSRVRSVARQALAPQPLAAMSVQSDKGEG